MKNLLLILTLTFCTIISAQSQSVQHAFKWEASTITGGVYMGITSTRKQALVEIQQLMAEKGGNEGVVDFEVRFSPIDSSSNKDIFDEFLGLNEDNITYAYLSKEDLEAIRVNKKWGKTNCIQYFSNTRKFKNKKTMLSYLENKVLAYEKFLFIGQNKKSKEVYALK